MSPKAPFLCALVASAAMAGSLIPSMATIVNEAKNKKSIDPQKFGYIGLTYKANLEGVARMDLKNLADGNRIRILMNPEMHNTISFSVGPIVLGKKELPRDTLKAPVLLQQLPAGKYVISYFYLDGKSSGITVSPDTLSVETGKILSLGNLTGFADVAALIPVVKSLKVATGTAIPDSSYSIFGELGINTKEITSKSVTWTK